MKKMTWGVNGAKLNAYIKTMRRGDHALVLRTVRDAYNEDHVWLLTEYMALRVPAGWIYKEVLQPYTMTDAPEFGEHKDLNGGRRDGESLVRAAENIMERATLTAKNTGFRADMWINRKESPVRIFALEDGTPVAVRAEIADIFERGQFVSYRGSTSTGAIVIEGEYVKGIVLPIRVDSELRDRMAALCACYALPGARKGEQAA